MALTDTAVRNAKPAEKPHKLADDRGLYLLVKPDRRQALALQVPDRGQRKAAGARRLSRREP